MDTITFTKDLGYMLMFKEDRVVSPVTYSTFDAALRDGADLAKAYPGKGYVIFKKVGEIKYEVEKDHG